MSTHTEEPWEARQHRGPSSWNGMWLARAPGDVVLQECGRAGEANLKRAVVCVNALAGIKDPAALRKALDLAAQACDEDRADGFDELGDILRAAGL